MQLLVGHFPTALQVQRFLSAEVSRDDPLTPLPKPTENESGHAVTDSALISDRFIQHKISTFCLILFWYLRNVLARALPEQIIEN